jgi:nucleoporin NUP82
MDSDDDWSKILDGHPIFSLPNSFRGPTAQPETSLELSTSNLPSFTSVDPAEDGPTPSGRRQVMVLKDADLIVAAGKEIRIASLGETKSSRSSRQTFKAGVHPIPVQLNASSLWTDFAHTQCSV